jgi:DeoR family fructose operon transcriptional repressor
MGKIDSNISQNQRLEYIRKEISHNGEVFIRDLAQKFNVSEMTIRRDIMELESQGEVIRTHGGAASAKRLSFEFTFRSEQQKNLKQKHAIAQKALNFIKDGEVVVLDTGTTTLELARGLVGVRTLKVITISLPIVSELQFAPEIETILLGGNLRPLSPDLHGPLTEQNLSMFKTDTAFLGAGAIDSEGNVYTDDLRVLNLDRKMIEISKKVVILADSSKFQEQAMCKITGPEGYHVLITDSGINPKVVKKLAGRGINVQVV